MVTAILPSLTGGNTIHEVQARDPRKPPRNPHDSITPSLDSELTITPERFRELSGGSESTVGVDAEDDNVQGKGKPSALAGYVGLFTGCGALVALSVFLPLPTQFGQIGGVTLGEAISYSFYVVGSVALIVAVFVGFGLRNLKGEEGKGWRLLLGLRRPGPSARGGDDRAESKVCEWLTSCGCLELIKSPEALAVLASSKGRRQAWFHRLSDRPGLSRRLRRSRLDRRHIALHPPVRQLVLHEQWLLPRVSE